MPISALHNGLRLAPNREMTELYVSVALKSFAIGLIGIFEPIYLLEFFDGKLAPLFLYYGASAAIFSIFAAWGTRFAARIGIKRAMLYSVIPLFLYFILLWKIEEVGFWFVLLIPLVVVYKLLFWPAFHIDFARFSDEGFRGREISYTETASYALGALAPAVGGFLIMNYGFPSVFALVLVLLIVSGAVLFATADAREKYDGEARKVLTEIRKERGRAAAFAAEGVESTVYLLIWPLFLFFAAISFEGIGFIISGAMLVGLLFRIYLGRLIDRKGAHKVLKLGAALNFLTWPWKIFVNTPWTAFLAHSIHQFSRGAVVLPFAALFYGWASEPKKRDMRVVFREIVLNSSRGVFLLILALLFLYEKTSFDLRWLFIVAAVFSLGLASILRSPRNN